MKWKLLNEDTRQYIKPVTGEGTYVLRVNGRGNAWPNPIGQKHPFYTHGDLYDYANASFSILIFAGPGRDKESLLREFMVDAGHGSIPMLLKTYNRIPEAIFITHPHFDHILGVDWIAQSYYRYHDKKKYPLYATSGCWGKMVETFPHLAQIIDFQELSYGNPVTVESDPAISVTAYPVYHGPHALGACMLYFVLGNRGDRCNRILFTGDVLTPLLRSEDYETLLDVDLVVADSNNRFPYPRCNHWSIISGRPPGSHDYLHEWMVTMSMDHLLDPHMLYSSSTHNYFEKVKNEKWDSVWCPSMFDFIKRVLPGKVLVVHYGGMEDERYYFDRILTPSELDKWIKREARQQSVPSEFLIPETASIYNL